MKELNKLKDLLTVMITQVFIVFLFIVVTLKKRLSTIGMLLIFGLASTLAIYIAAQNKPLFELAISHFNNLRSDMLEEKLWAYSFILTFLLIISGVTFVYTSYVRKMIIRHKIINTLGYEAWEKVDQASIWSMLKRELNNKK